MDLTMMAPPELEELTTCSFCHFPFNDTDAVPKLFTCRHYFCLKCVNLLLRDGSDEIVCINCWKRTILEGPEPKIKNLPNHNGILYLIQNFNALNMNANKSGINFENRNDDRRILMNDTNILTNNFGNLNGDANMMMMNNFNSIGTATAATQATTQTANNQNVCIIEMDEKERSPSIASSSGGSMASSIALGGISGFNCNGNGNGGNGSNNNNYGASSSASSSSNNNNNGGGGGVVAICSLKIGENCMTHAMPKTLWCSTCGIQLCRACAGSDEHRMHPVRNQIEAKESLHNDISCELKTMHKTLNDVQQLLLRQRDFLVKILESCTTLKSQIESELINPLPTAEIAEMRETLMKANLCLELLEKQTPGDALKLYTTLHSEKQRLVAKYQEMFLQCKLDELIKNCGYVFDFDLIKQALIQYHNCAINGGGLENLNGINQMIQQNPILLLTNYCISQLYSRHMLVLKQQQQQEQQQQEQHQEQQQQQQQQQLQMQHHQGLNLANQLNQQQQHLQMNNFNQQQQAEQQQHIQQQFQQQSTLLPNGFLNSLITNINSTNNNNENSNNNNNNIDNTAQQTTYAQALQQSTSKAQQQQHQQQPPIGQPRAETTTTISKSYASIINNANKTNIQAAALHQQHQQQLQKQQQQQQQSQLLQQTTTKLIESNEFPVLAPIGTRSNGTASSSSSASSSTTLSVQQRTTTHIFATKATSSTTTRNDLNNLNLNMLHMQQQQNIRAHGNSIKQKHHHQQQLQLHQSKPTPLILDPNVHIYPIYYFDIEIEGERCGRFLIEVRHDVAPKMAKNFNSLVTQEFGFGYKGCQVFQCWDNESIITGDYELNNGRGGRSVFKEAFFLPEDTKILGIRGSVGMRRSQKRHDNMGLVGSQFRIILREMRGFTGIFGFVIDGLELVERVSKVGDPTGRPQSIVVISGCGKY